jgi:hypothetical protein
MKGLLLCALLTMAAVAQAETVSGGSAIDSRADESAPQSEPGTVGGERLLIAQVAAETAQLVPREKPDIGKGPKIAPRTGRAARPARNARTTRTARTHSRAVIAASVRNYRPAPVTSRFLSNADQFAKANGCAAPVTKMNFAVVGTESFETFTANCASKARMSIRCDAAQCRVM